MINMTGQTIGRLTVLRRDDNKPIGKAFWYCQCKCGSTTSVWGSNLRRGHVTSCGCKRRDRFKYEKRIASESGKWKGYEEISGTYWKNLKSNAKLRKLSLTLTIEEAWELFVKQDRKCALSGLDLNFTNMGVLGSASLDRIDSSGGYVLSNLQWVHKDVNRMKSNFTDDYFKDICKKVATNA